MIKNSIHISVETFLLEMKFKILFFFPILNLLLINRSKFFANYLTFPNITLLQCIIHPYGFPVLIFQDICYDCKQLENWRSYQFQHPVSYYYYQRVEAIMIIFFAPAASARVRVGILALPHVRDAGIFSQLIVFFSVNRKRNKCFILF